MSQISTKFIKDNNITNAKLAQMATLTIKGNNTGGTANALDLTVAQVKTMLSLSGTNSGDVTLTAVGATPNANGASLSTQALTLQPANASFPGVLLAADWTTFNNKLSSSLTSAHIFVGNGSNVATDVAVTGDVTISNAGVTAIGTNKVTNSQLAQMATLTLKGNNTGGTANALDLTVSQVQTMLSVPTSSSPLPLNAGGTGTSAASANAAFNALSPLTTKGDLLTYSTVNARLAVGTDGQFLVADSTQTTGNKWASNIRTLNSQTGTTYTFVLADGSGAGGQPLVTFNNASAITVTVPTNASVAFPVGTQIDMIQTGAGKVTISPAGGVTVNSQGANLSIAAQYVAVSLIKTDTNSWILIGNLIA